MSTYDLSRYSFEDEKDNCVDLIESSTPEIRTERKTSINVIEHTHFTGVRWMYYIGDLCVNRKYTVKEYRWSKEENKLLEPPLYFQIGSTTIKQMISGNTSTIGPQKFWLFIPWHLMKLYGLNDHTSPLKRFLEDKNLFRPFSWRSLSYSFLPTMSFRAQAENFPPRFRIASELTCPRCELNEKDKVHKENNDVTLLRTKN